MAMRVVYTTVNGRVLSENRDGVKRDYVADPLGSTVALLDNTQTQTDTFTYWPYGEVRTRAGTTPTPFQFVGTVGYYRDSAIRGYVRARTARFDIGRWLTQDPLLLSSAFALQHPVLALLRPFLGGRPGSVAAGLLAGGMSAFAYAMANPVTWRDHSGLVPEVAIGAIIGCLVSGSVGAIIGIFEGPCMCICRGLGNCLVGALVGAIASLLPSGGIKCLAGLISGGLGQVVGSACQGICNGNWSLPHLGCAVFSILASTVLACIWGALEGGPNSAVAPLLKGIVQIIQASLGKICGDAKKYASLGATVYAV